MTVFRAPALSLAMATLLLSCSDSVGPTSTSPLPKNEPSFAQSGSPNFAKGASPSFEDTGAAKDEDFNCTNLQKVRVRFGHPGFVTGPHVGLFAEFVGMPGDGSKIVRVWWDFEGDPETFEDIDVSDQVRHGDEGLFDWDGVLEHSYDVRMPTNFRVRIELIVTEQTGNCARVRDVTVEPIKAAGGG